MGSGIAVYSVIGLLTAEALLAICFLIWNMLGLFAVMRLNSDNKAGRLLKTKAVVKLSIPAQAGSSRAVADYSVNERKVRGKMIGKSRERLTGDQTVKILVSEKIQNISRSRNSRSKIQ